MKLLIKNMVCRHCVEAVKGILAEIGHPEARVELGHAEIQGTLTENELNRLDSLLADNGFHRILSHDDRVIDLIKRCIIRHVRIERRCPLNLSTCLTEHIPMSYDAMSRLFSAHEGRTLEKYFIAQKIELVKELLEYNELSLAEIADMTGFSSAAHLSRRFKAVTGITPSAYAAGTHPPRRPINEI